MRLLREKRVQGRPRRRKGAEEAPGPPAESECLEWKTTSNCTNSKKLYASLLFSNLSTENSSHPMDGCCFISLSFFSNFDFDGKRDLIADQYAACF